MAGRKAGWVCVLVVLAGSASCTFQKIRLAPDRVRAVTSAPRPALPESYRMVHRLRLDVRGRRYDLIGYLAVAGDRWRAVAFSELGGKIFDLLGGPAAYEVLSSPRGMPTGALLEGIMPELGLIFAASDQPKKEAAGAGAPERSAVTAELPKQFEINPDKTLAPVSIEIVKSHRVVSEIALQSFRSIEGWPNPVPERLRIVNRTWGYTIEATLLRMDLRPVEAGVFKK